MRLVSIPILQVKCKGVVIGCGLWVELETSPLLYNNFIINSSTDQYCYFSGHRNILYP